jgi:lipopolysaccharide/colanic/teichoic acid biosynthesis glycosyltransferase
MPGRVFDASRDEEVMGYLECLMQVWRRPDSTVARAVPARAGLWADRDAELPAEVRVVGQVWVGAGRALPQAQLVVGPAILWDEPEAEPPSGSVAWEDLEPLAPDGGLAPPRRFQGVRRAGKRLFDIMFSLVVLALTLPLYPFIALAIVLEDGWPVFFAHRRETLGGREFNCLKFRSMRRDAEKIKLDLQAENVSDGPQFFVRNDPRSTRVGAFLRRTQLDELPQFLNALVGHMSVVGPRPSPRSENQYCPAWREARLSVRPGLTGLWQVRRTRAEGLDFQEWIRYDLEYVERMSWHLDLWIIWKTVGILLRGGRRR